MNGAPELSVVIPTRGRAELLRDTLSALLRQTYGAGEMEILVVMDGADPDTAALIDRVAARAPCRIQALEQERSGQASARNLGIERASGRVIVMLDDDIVASPRLLQEHARHHARAADLVVTGSMPVERVPDEPAHQRNLRLWWDGELAAKASSDHQPTFRDFTTGNVSVTRARLLEIGGFDADFSGYGREDYELGHRLLRAGLRFIHEPQALGVHRYDKPPLEWLRQWRAMGRADAIFARKHPDVTADVMALSAVAPVRWRPAAVRLGERAVLRLNRRGGPVWRQAAGYVMASHYWAGVAQEANGTELERLRRLSREARRGQAGASRMARLGRGVTSRLRRIRPAWTW